MQQIDLRPFCLVACELATEISSTTSSSILCSLSHVFSKPPLDTDSRKLRGDLESLIPCSCIIPAGPAYFP